MSRTLKTLHTRESSMRDIPALGSPEASLTLVFPCSYSPALQSPASSSASPFPSSPTHPSLLAAPRAMRTMQLPPSLPPSFHPYSHQGQTREQRAGESGNCTCPRGCGLAEQTLGVGRGRPGPLSVYVCARLSGRRPREDSAPGGLGWGLGCGSGPLDPTMILGTLAGVLGLL